MPEALEASSLHGFQCDRQLRLELYSATLPWPRKTQAETVFCSCRLKKEEPHPGLQHCFGGKRDRGEPLMLNVSVRPQPAAVAAVSALAATAGKTSPTRSWLNRSPLAANQRCRLCSPGIGPTSTAGFFGSSAMRRLPRTS